MIRISIIIMICALFAIGLSDNSVKKTSEEMSSSTTAAANAEPTTTPKQKIIVKDSEVCKRCLCDTINLKIDCSNQSRTILFTADEWEILRNGDITFEILNFDHNNISYVPALPPYAVKSLNLSFNGINNISVGAFENLTQLNVLDLSNNNLTSKSLRPQVFKGPYAADNYEPINNLKVLDLTNNELHTLHRDLFEHFPNLEALSLSKNTFHVIDPSSTIAIASLNSLKTLDLSYMELGELPDTLLHSPLELETLNLCGNLFQTLPVALTRATHLKKLILDENPLVDIDDTNVFKSLAELEYLSISYLPDVRKIGPWALSELQSLTTLIAEYNPHLKHIHKLAFTKNTSNPDIFDYPPLKKLVLRNNNLTTIEHDWISRWEKIDELDLRFNPWTCDCTNSWLIHSLMKQINNTTPALTRDVVCSTPSVWKNKPLMELTDNKNEFLCENSSRPENDSLIFVGILVGILVGIPLTLGVLVVYRKGCFGVLNRQNHITNRSLYNRASFADEFHI